MLTIFRWWVASHGCQHSLVPVKETLLRDSLDCINKLRNVLRFLLGTLHQYSVKNTVEPQYLHLDRYMLHRLYHFNEQVK